MYQQSPCIPLVYVDYLEAFNTAKWTGWTQEYGGTGGAWQLEGNIQSYFNLRPRVVTATTSGASNTALVAVVVVVVFVAAGAAFVILRRRGRQIEDEA